MNLNINFQPSVFSKVSHEIRTPLTGILGMTHFLAQTPLSAQQTEYLNNIIESAQRLLIAEKKICDLFRNYSQGENV